MSGAGSAGLGAARGACCTPSASAARACSVAPSCTPSASAARACSVAPSPAPACFQPRPMLARSCTNCPAAETVDRGAASTCRHPTCLPLSLPLHPAETVERGADLELPAGLQAALQEEAGVMSRLRHPNVVS